MNSPDPVEKMSVDDLESEMFTLSSQIAAADARFVALIAEYDARRAWARWECQSCAHWLEWKCQIGAGAARERVRVARAVIKLPLIFGEFSRGRLSYSQVRALTRAATPENEAEMLRVARHMTASQLEDAVRAMRGAITADEAAARHEARSARWYYEDDDCLVIKIKVTPEDGAAVVMAINSIVDEMRCEDVSAETSGAGEMRRTTEQLRSDALVFMAKAALEGRDHEVVGGNGRHVVIHTDASVLADGTGKAYVEAGPSISAEAVEKITCDAEVTAIYERSPGEVIAVGRTSRKPTAKQRKALWIRDRHCRFPGCTNRRFVDAHHIWHWSKGGPTELWNLVLLCRFHHTSVHDRKTTLHRSADGLISARTKSGHLLGPAEALCEVGPDDQIEIESEPVESQWEGTSRNQAREALLLMV